MGTVEETKSRLKYALNLLRIVMYPKQLQIIDTQAKEASATDKHKQYRVFQLYGCLGSPEKSRPASIFAMILAKGTPKFLGMNLSKVIYDMVPKSVLG